MKSTSQTLSLLLAATGAAASTLISCDSFGEATEGDYILYHNNWGAAEATSGSQCTYLDSLDGETIAWHTNWTWAGGSSSVKSYSNVALTDINKQLSEVSSIPAVWDWTYTGDDLVADVSFDLWLAPTSGGTDSYEIMVWLAALNGAGPISSSGSAVATPSIANSDWELYSGTNGDTTVYSFVATDDVNSFDGDIMDFFNYLTENEGVDTSLYITQLQAGTEPFDGTDAVFTTTAYSISVS